MTESSTTQLVGVAAPTLHELRSAVLSSGPDDSAVASLREAGFAGGAAIHDAFERWTSEESEESKTSADVGDLSLEAFGERAGRFFRDAGWGDVTFIPDETEGIATVDIVNCWEGAADSVGCHLTTGMLAAFFGKVAGYPIAVLETECCAGDGSRCRFLLGNSEVMQYQWEQLQAGS